MAKKKRTEYQLQVQMNTTERGPRFLDVCGQVLVDKTQQERHFDDRDMDACFTCKMGNEQPTFSEYLIDVVGDWPWWRVQMSSTTRHALFSVDAQELDKLDWGNAWPMPDLTEQSFAFVLNIPDSVHIAVRKRVYG